jgi:hypothetical protein
MTNIILPQEEEETIKYEATEKDEENFFLMYHLNFQPSEVEKLDPNYRKWLIGRFVAQKSLEQEAMERRQLMNKIGPSFKA